MLEYCIEHVFGYKYCHRINITFVISDSDFCVFVPSVRFFPFISFRSVFFINHIPVCLGVKVFGCPSFVYKLLFCNRLRAMQTFIHRQILSFDLVLYSFFSHFKFSHKFLNLFATIQIDSRCRRHIKKLYIAAYIFQSES